MKAIARLVWTYLTALPILRWVGGVALASLPFALLAIWPRTRGFIALPIIAFAMHSLSMTIAAGYLFRVLSSPRSNRFLPHFRGRSLAAFLAIVVVVSAPWLVIVVWAALRPPYAATLVAPLFIMIAMVAFTFFPVGAAVTLASLLAIGWVATHLGSQHAAIAAAPPDAVPSAFAIALTLLCVWGAIWAAFSIWYLRVRRIEPFQTPAMILDKIGIKPAAGSIVFDRRRAFEASLTAASPQSTKQVALWIAMLVIGTRLAGGALSATHLPLYTARFFLFFPGLIIPGTLLAAVATRLARHTRSLWLKGGLSRRGLLAATEKQIWRRAAPGAIAVSVVLSTGIALAYDVSMPVLARGLASAAATALLAVYLGVAFVRDSRLIETFVAAVLIASACVGAWTALSAPEHDQLWLATILSQAAAALVFRGIAIAQWRKIDWLVFKPVRIWSQSLR
jgi:hypothetical protein